MSDYNQCHNGHYYQGEECPYCKGHFSDGILQCNHCGKPILIKMPLWSVYSDGENYGWNGVCENCGHDYSKSVLATDEDFIKKWKSVNFTKIRARDHALIEEMEKECTKKIYEHN